MSASKNAPAGLIVVYLGAGILVASHLLPWALPGTDIHPTVRTAVSVVAYLAMAAGAFLALGSRGGAVAVAPVPSGPPAQPARPPAPRETDDTAATVLETILLWSDQLDEEADLWRSFDQLVRELFVEFAGASRVRLFVPRPGGLVPIASEGTDTSDGTGDDTPVEDPVLTQAAATGREYFSGEGEPPGPEMLDSTAWAWVIPVRWRGRLLGVVAAGRLDRLRPPDAARRRLMSAVVAWLWDYAQTLWELRRTRQIDKASGLLTRPDFFARATAVVRESNAAHEPFVVVAIAVEGLRRLDDQGFWDARDELIEAIGRVIRSRMRSDDIIGRFSDDRFVVLLRRLDRSLGLLIARKVVEGVRAYLDSHARQWGSITIRAGVAGGSAAQGELEATLVAALEAIDRARHEGVELLEAPQAREARENRS